MKAIVIKSNHGNHTGFNRKWELIAVVDTVKEAREELVQQSIYCVDGCNDWIMRNGRMWNTANKEYLYTTDRDSFSEDLRTYTFVTQNEVETFFDGGHNGYMPSFIVKEFGHKIK